MQALGSDNSLEPHCEPVLHIASGTPALHTNGPIGSFGVSFPPWYLSVCLFPVQEARCLHLWCSRAQLHGRKRWRLQAGDHWQWQGLCFYWLWHCHPERFWVEAPGGPCYSAAIWRWWVKERGSVHLVSTNGHSEIATSLLCISKTACHRMW